MGNLLLTVRHPRALAPLVLGLLLAGCAADSDSEADGAGLPAHNPWVQGGQTGALGCGPTQAALDGAAIPAGAGGIVIRTADCEDFDAGALALLDAEGRMVDFDLEALDGEAVLIRPQVDLEEGVYELRGVGTEPADVPVGEVAELPMTLGTLEPAGDGCNRLFELTLDPEVLDYLPQLKLSARVDDGMTETWIDFGALEEEDRRATLQLPACLSSCVGEGEHELELIGELAGELGTLEPLVLPFHLDCGGDDDGGRCSASGRPDQAPWPAWLTVAALWLRSRRRVRPPG